MSRLAVVIVNWNTRELLRGCLTSLFADLAQAGVGDSDVIVVDSASHDGSAAMVAADFPQVTLRAQHDNIGYVRGNNLALLELGFDPDEPLAGAGRIPDFVWLLNPDTIVHPGCIAALLALMRTRDACGMCGPKLLNPDGSLQHGAFGFPGLMQLAIDTQPPLARFRNTRWDGRYSPAQFEAGQPFEIGFPLGAGMLVRAHAVARAGLLDEGFEMYCEEVDWAMRMRGLGFERWCVPSAVLTHFGGASSSQASARAQQLLWQSRRRYYRKHYGALKLRLALLLAPAA
jgi:N-acetylglucosaminyl-diphospho-decaprenol L-rhamnosyltransferase